MLWLVFKLPSCLVCVQLNLQCHGKLSVTNISLETRFCSYFTPGWSWTLENNWYVLKHCFNQLFSGCKGETEDQSRRNPDWCCGEKEADWSGREGSGQKRQGAGCHCQTTCWSWELQGGNHSPGQKVCTCKYSIWDYVCKLSCVVYKSHVLRSRTHRPFSTARTAKKYLGSV